MTFERWRERGRSAGAAPCCYLTRDDLMRHAAAAITVDLFPETMALGGNALPLKYRFMPGHPLDGLTLTVPLPLLNQLPTPRLTWLVPGMMREKVTHYLKALPKAVAQSRDSDSRIRHGVPVESSPAQETALPDALARVPEARLGDALPAELLARRRAPAASAMNIAVVDDAATGARRRAATLPRCARKLGEAAQLSFAAGRSRVRAQGAAAMGLRRPARALTFTRGGRRLTGLSGARRRGRRGVPRAARYRRRGGGGDARAASCACCASRLRDALARYDKGGTGFAQAALQLKAAIPTDRLLADVLAAALTGRSLADDPLPRTERAFAEQVKRARARLPAVMEGAFRLLAGSPTNIRR